MIRVVLDTSVVVSAVISPHGPNAEVFDLIIARKIRPCMTDEVLDEYQRVFDYDTSSSSTADVLLGCAACWKLLASRLSRGVG